MLSHTEDEEIHDFNESILDRYGYDFRGYAFASLKRRVIRASQKHGMSSVKVLQDRLLKDKALFTEVLSDLTVTVTEMFRDPHFYRAFVENIVPRLESYPSVRIWHAGCSTGEEVYSLAILLKEAGILEKSTLYATDINPLVLQKARRGVYRIEKLVKSTQNYLKVSKASVFSDYYTADHGAAIMESFLKERIVFAEHNLVTDESFSEVQVVLCRNVFIYFNKILQNRALQVFYDSLCYKGFLCIGSKESIRFSDFDSVFEEIDSSAKIYRKSGVDPVAYNKK